MYYLLSWLFGATLNNGPSDFGKEDISYTAVIQ